MPTINLQNLGNGDVVLSNDMTPIIKSPPIGDRFNLSDVQDRISSKTPITTPKKGTDLLSIFDIPGLKPGIITPSRKGIQAMDYDVPFRAIYDRRWDGTYSTKFDNYMGATGNEDRLAKESSFIGNLGRGAYRFGAKTINYALDATLGTVAGITTSISKGSVDGFWDNDISNWLDHANEELDYQVGQLYTDEYKSNNILENIFSGNVLDFATGDLLDGLSFIAGAILPEVAINFFTGGSLLPATLAGVGAKFGSKIGKEVVEQGAKSTIKGATSVIKEAERKTGLNLLRTKWWSGVGKNVGEVAKTSSFIARTSGFEASMEARGAFHDAVDNFHNNFLDKNGREPSKEEIINFYKDAKSAANGVFGANMAILSLSNLAMFGATFGVANKFRASVNNTGKKFLGLAPKVGETGKLSLPELSKGRRALGSIYNTLGTPLIEANEEGLQNAIHSTMNNYLEAKYDPNKDSSYGFTSALTDGFSQAYGSNQGRKEIGMGFIIGLIAPFLQKKILRTSGHETFKQQRAGVEEAVKNANNAYDNYSTTITRQLNNSNVAKVFSDSMLNSNLEAQNNGDTPPIQDLNTAILHKQFIDSQLPLKSREQIVKEYDSIVDNIQFDDSVKDQVGNVDDYKELLKSDFKRNSENHRIATSIVNNLGLSNSINLDKTKGNTIEIGDQLVALMMQGEAAKNSKQNLGDVIDNITGSTGSMSAIDFFSNLSSDKKKKAILLNNRRRDLRDARRQFVEHSRLLNDLSSTLNRNFTSTTLESRKNKVAERHEVLRQKIEKLDIEVNSIKEDLRGSSDVINNLAKDNLGDIENIPVTDDILSKLDKLDSLDNYVQTLKNNDNKSDANYLEYLISQYKYMNDTHNELYDTFSSMSKSGFFRSKKGRGLVDSMIGPTYVMSEDFKNKIKERRDVIDRVFEKIGVRGENAVEEAIKERLSDNNLSDREKFKLENIFRIFLDGQDRLLQAEESFKKSTENYSEEDVDNKTPLKGDTIISLVREESTKEGITDVERIQKIIDVMLQEVDNIRGKTRRQQLESLKGELQSLKDNNVDSKIESIDNRIKESESIKKDIDSDFKKDLKELEKNTDELTEEELSNKKEELKSAKDEKLEEQEEKITKLNSEKYDLENSDIKKKLEDITRNGTIEEEIDKLDEEIKSLENPKIFRKGEYTRFEQLTKKKFTDELTDDEQKEFDELSDDLDQWIAISGMNVDGYRLSDLIELRSQLENSPIKNVENVVQPEKLRSVSNIFKIGQSRANYDFGQSQNVVTITGLIKNTREYISIQGIRLEDLLSKLPSDFNLQTSTKEFKDESVRGNIVLSMDEVNRINSTQESDILINPPIENSESNYGLLLTRTGDNTYSPLVSTFINDFSSPMQTEQIYNSNIGDVVKLKVDTQNPYNKDLLDNLRDANTDKQKEKAKKALRENLIVEVWLGDKYNISTLKAKNQRIKTRYDVRFEAMRNELIDNEESLNELLIRDVFEQGDENFPIKGDVKIKTIMLGQPNVIVTKNDNGEVSIVSKVFSENDAKKVSDIGYIEGDRYFTKSGRTEFEKSFVSNLENTAGRTPFIIVKMGDKFIAYPVELKVESKPDNSLFKEIYNSDTSDLNKILKLNSFMADRGVDIKKDGNHFNQVNINDKSFFDGKLAQVENIDYFYNLEDWVSSNRGIDEILMNEAMTDLNLSEPFISPKIAMDFSDIDFNENSYKIDQDSITLASEREAEYTSSAVLDKITENTCKK